MTENVLILEDLTKCIADPNGRSRYTAISGDIDKKAKIKLISTLDVCAY